MAESNANVVSASTVGAKLPDGVVIWTPLNRPLPSMAAESSRITTARRTN